MNLDEQQDVAVDFATTDEADFAIRIKPREGKRVVKLETSSTVEFRDLTGALFDMKRVVELCQEYLSIEESDAASTTQTVQDALWMSAVVLYARCFNNGVRQRLDRTALDAVPGQAHEAHQHFLHLRDKFLAHSVSVYEQTPVIAVIDSATNGVQKVGTIHAWAIPMNKLGMQHLRQLAQAFIEAGEKHRERLEQQVLEEARAKGPEEIRRLPDLKLTTPAPENAGRPRKL